MFLLKTQKKVLTFSHSEEVSKVSHDVVYRWWFKALDIAQSKEGFIVC